MTDKDWIQFTHISKRFNKLSQVGEINLALKKGQIAALCGGNGAGKSTFIKVITGVMKGTSGEIAVDGVSVKPNSMEYRELFSYMPDNMLFPSQLTGLEVLTFFARLRKIKREKVLDMLHLVGLYEAKDRLIKHYSKGMQQRLSFAQALLPDAPFIILDEPTNGLDPYWFYRFKEILKGEKEKGKTILFTTHVLSLVEEIADRVAFMENGKIISNDTVENLVNRDGKVFSLEQVFFEKQITNS
jgi:ABC-type multidrug transport system ATPase subunit